MSSAPILTAGFRPELTRQLVGIWSISGGTPAASAVKAAPYGSTIANQWTSIGPTPISNGQTNPQSVPVSGRVNAIAFNPSNSNIIYIGAADGGVWETTDGGTTWTPLTDGQCSMSMGALAIDPVNSNIVYAGTGEEELLRGQLLRLRRTAFGRRRTDLDPTWRVELRDE